jgi:microcystin degradation protein MlrC
MWHDRQALNSTTSNHLGIDAAIDAALAAKPPVCLLDMGDNVGGGSPGDGVWLASALAARRIPDSLAVVCDANASRQAVAAGVGARIQLSIGGESGPSSGTPVLDTFKVRGIYDGRFSETAATHGGFTDFDQGQSAVLVTDDGLTILATTRRMVPFSLTQLTSCGLDPAKFRIVVAKGVNAPIAAYSKVCRTFLRVDTPGPTTADMTKLSHSSRRKPMFPFESDCEWQLAQHHPTSNE